MVSGADMYEKWGPSLRKARSGHPGLHCAGDRGDVGGRGQRVRAEQLPGLIEQRAEFIQLFLQRRLCHEYNASQIIPRPQFTPVMQCYSRPNPAPHKISRQVPGELTENGSCASPRKLFRTPSGMQYLCSAFELTGPMALPILTGVLGPGSGGEHDDKALVDALLRELSEAAERWEALVAEAERTMYSVDLGDIKAKTNSDGRLIALELHPGVTQYAHDELAERLNTAFTALREESEAENRKRYSDGIE